MSQIWMKISTILEKQGVPFLLAVFCSILTIVLLQLKVIQDFWQAYFVLDFPDWHIATTVVFILIILPKNWAHS
jgi:hypothetical protein